jgi:hypothetical protein
MVDPTGNLSMAMGELRGKFDRFVNGPTSGTRADDRIAEAGSGPLRECRFERTDPRFLRDCQACLREATSTDIAVGTPFYARSSGAMQYYKKLPYRGVPRRKDIPCDWPYAARRYNGSGVNSYHYQTIVLLNLLKG